MPRPKQGKREAPAERHLSVAIVKPDDSALSEHIKDSVNLIGDAIGVCNPWAGLTIKAVAVLGGWLWIPRKYERVRSFIHALADRVKGMRDGFVKHEEFADLLEDVLRRLSEQPDPDRRKMLRAIFEKVIEEPREHCENRLFLRLADELPSGALRLLSIVDNPVGPSDRNRHLVEVISEATGLQASDVRDHIDELLANQILSGNTHRFVPMPGKAIDYLLTRKGRAFVDYCRG
jgi:hypothetical protein